MPTIDVLIITYNESVNLPHCLRSLEGWTRQVFVVDSGSTDGTPELAREHGAQVIHHDWPGYSAQRNWALDNLPIEADWVLILDADELITAKLCDDITAITAKPLDQVPENGFFINRLTYFLNKPIRHCGYFPSWNMRLFKRGSARYENRQVHEHMIIDDPVGYIREPMLHDDRRGLEHFYAKHNRYSTLEAREVYREIMGLRDDADAANLTAETRRRRWLKRHVTRRVPFPGLWRFLYMYIFRLGVLDGITGYRFCRLISQYDFMVATKLRIMLSQHGEPLEQHATYHGLATPEGASVHNPYPAETPDIRTTTTESARVSAGTLTTANFLNSRLSGLVDKSDRVLITGGSGFIGTNLLQLYVDNDVEVLNLDVNPPRNTPHNGFWKQVDLLDDKGLSDAIRSFEPTLVFHLAARTDLTEVHGVDDYKSNTEGMENFLRAVEPLKCLRRLVVTSSQLVCKPGYIPRSDNDYQPHTSYGRSKVITEQITREWSNAPCPWVIVRPTSIWGPWFDIPYRDFFLAVAKRRYVHQRGINPLRSFGFVGNAVFQYASYASIDPSLIDHQTFYLSDFTPVRVRHWAEQIQKEMGMPPLHELPLSVLKAAARVGDAAKMLGWTEPPITSFRLKNLTSDNYIEMDDVSRIMGPEPYRIDEGVAVTVQWLREQRLIATR